MVSYAPVICGILILTFSSSLVNHNPSLGDLVTPYFKVYISVYFTPKIICHAKELRCPLQPCRIVWVVDHSIILEDEIRQTCTNRCMTTKSYGNNLQANQVGVQSHGKRPFGV